MPRTISPELADCLRRANPYTEYRTEISVPDAVRIIRRADEFVGAPPLIPPMVPANSLSADARGGLILSPGQAALASFAVENSSYDLNGEDPQRRVKGAVMQMDPLFKGAKLKSVTARVQRVALAGLFFNLDFELQVYRITKTPGFKEKYIAGNQQVQVTAFTDYTFTPLLNPAPVIKSGAIAWDGAQKSTLNFDLTNWGLVLENTPSRAAAPDQAGELPRYYFVVRVLNNPKGTGFFRWLLDSTTARTLANIGTFQRSWWARDNDQQQWVETLFADVPCFAVNVETYPATGQAWYAIDLGKAPAANAIGRVVFERSLPPGTDADLQLSSTGPATAFAFVKHGDVVAVSQQNYWLSVRLFSDASNRATPVVTALGIEWRIPIDVSVEGIPQLPTREISLPWPKASIPEGKVTIVRTGVRDYLDTASVIGSTQATTKLECDIYLASRHPSVTREKWLHLERLAVSNRVPGSTSEALTLLSYASKLKKKIPQKVESLNSVHTVTGGTTSATTVAPALPGTSPGGNEYDNKGYYMRVRSTSNVNVAVGFVQTIQGNTGTGQLDFVPAMPSALAIGDVIEVHSGIFATQKISWTDADPADVWDAILSYAGVVPERIGAGYLPRGGKPPRVTDIAPGDAATQAKLKVTNQLTELEAADELLAQVSAILGGVTLEMPGGQICFVQLFPLRDATGKVTIPLPPVVKVFDKRDYGISLQTPPGLEKRATVMSATFGVPLTAAAPESYPKQTTVMVDNDALLWLTQQDLEDFGSAQIPDKIARWLYNTSDAGLYLASSVTATYVRALSTGLRVFPFNAIEKNPELVPGDSVVLLTDQYTDYEPSSGTPLRGMLAVRGVLVQVGAEGRQLALFVPGLQDNVTQARGGNAGTLTGLGEPIDPPVLSGSFLATGELIITSQGAPATASQRVAVGTVEPTDAFTRASTPILQQNITNVATGLIVAAGGSAWIKAFAYDNYGNESLVAKVKVTREGSGTADPPVVLMYPLNGDSSDSAWNIRFDAVPGSGGGGVNLVWVIYKKIGFGAESILDSGDGTDLPADYNLTRHPRSDAVIRFHITDTATGLTAQDSFLLPSARPEITDAGDTFTSGVKETGGKLVSRLYAKALPADADTAESIANGLTKRVIPFSVIRTSDNYLLSGMTDSATVGFRPAASVARATHSSVWTEDWTADPAAGGWSIGGGTVSVVANNPDSTRGPNVLLATRYAPMQYNTPIPFDPRKLYRFRARFRKQVDDTGGNVAGMYIGVLAFKADGTAANSNGGANYCVAAGNSFSVASGWQQIDCWIKGASIGFGAAQNGTPATPNADAPGAFNVGTALIYPYLLINYPVVGTPDGTYEFDYYEITEYDEDAADRTYTVINTGQTLKTAAKESGAKPINRLYAKTLAADADTADSVIAGLTKRIILAGASDVSGNINLAGTAWINRHAANIATHSPTQDGVWSASGVTQGSGGLNDGDIGSVAWHTDTAVAGAFLQVDMGSGTTFDQCRIYAASDNGAANWKVRGSNNNSTWTDLATSFIPDRTGWNVKTFARQTWRYWRIELTNTPGAGPWNNEIEFADTGGGNMAAMKAINIGQLTERVVPFVDVGATMRTAAKESGGVAVNRLLAKTLAADPNSLDGAPDGLTYKKVTAVVGNQITPGSTVGRMRTKCTNNANWACGNGATVILTWNTESFDTGALHDTVTGNSKIIIPAGGNTGVWMLTAQVQWDPNANGSRDVYIMKNSATIMGRSVGKGVNFNAGVIGTVSNVVAWDDAPAVGDYYEVWVVQDAGVGINAIWVHSFFAATHMW